MSQALPDAVEAYLAGEVARLAALNAIALVRSELGTKAMVDGPVWQEMRDEWAALVRAYRAVYGPPAALDSGYLPSGLPPRRCPVRRDSGPLIA
jgi:hypothetical protein